MLAGHDDVVAGVTVTRDEELRDRLHLTRRLAGIVASADTAWLVRRGLKTLEVRLARQEETARISAERLTSHPAVEVVRYPGISFLIAFDVADGEAARARRAGGSGDRERHEPRRDPLKLEARHRWEGDRIPTGLIRLSVGLEDPEVSGPTSSRRWHKPDRTHVCGPLGWSERSCRTSKPPATVRGHELPLPQAGDMPTADTALPGRDTPMPAWGRTSSSGRRSRRFPEGTEQAIFGMGRFWGPSGSVRRCRGGLHRRRVPGGYTPNPRYEETCPGGPATPRPSVFDPRRRVL